MERATPTVVREETAPCRIKLNIEMPRPMVEAAFTDVEKQFKKMAEIPGFRKGKAPRKLLLQRYGEKIQEEVKDRLLRSGFNTAVKQEDLTPETAPHIENEESLAANKDESFVFAAEFDIAPTFDLPDYTSIDVSVETSSVDENQVENIIENILQSRTSYEQVDRPAQKEDLLKVSYEATLDEPADDLPESAKYLLSADETWIALREPEILPGITAELDGAETGTKKDVSITFPEDFHEDMLAGKTVPYSVEVHEVHAAEIPELTDELAQEMGAESAEHAKQQIRSNLEQQEAMQKQRTIRERILTKLMDQVDMPLPPQMLARETYNILMRLYQEKAQQGTPEEELKEKTEELRKQADEMAKASLKRHYILSRIADEEDIQVDREELEQMIQMLARSHQETPKKLKERLTQTGRIVELVDHIRENKATEKLVSLAHVEEKEEEN
ncbi:MAG: trigger factor [Candidatus Pacebacteria bacterium]|nr:trigger factor [Candidatus Paceibacterota bacterium]